MHMVIKQLFVLVLLGFTTEIALAAFAECGKSSEELQSWKKDKNYAELASEYVDKCASASNMQGELRVFIERIGSTNGDDRVKAVSQSLRLIMELLDEGASTQAIDRNAFAMLKSELQCDLDSFGSNLDEARCENNIQVSDGTIPIDKWRPRLTLGPVFEGAFVEPFRQHNPSCLAELVSNTSECNSVFVSSLLPALEIISLMHSQVVLVSNSLVAKNIVAGYSASHLRWKNYLAHTGLQYPWELTLNNSLRGGFEEIAKRKEAPTSRWIAFHPTVGSVYANDLPDGDQVNAVAILKVTGLKWWQYELNRPKNVWGVSLITTFADLASVDDHGIGLFLEYGDFGLGLSKHGSVDVISLNIDLGALLSNRPTSVDEWLQLIGD